MSDRETLKAELREVSAKAIQTKMDLHDLSEELPINWRPRSWWSRRRRTMLMPNLSARGSP